MKKKRGELKLDGNQIVSPASELEKLLVLRIAYECLKVHCYSYFSGLPLTRNRANISHQKGPINAHKA